VAEDGTACGMQGRENADRVHRHQENTDTLVGECRVI
jgi:hypothetical protein